MSEIKHTPGPWDCWDMDEFGWHVFADKFGTRERGQNCHLSIAKVCSGRSHTENSDNYYEGVANAHLIAAAPDLLAAAQMAVAWENGTLEQRASILDAARRAVDKAIPG